MADFRKEYIDCRVGDIVRESIPGEKDCYWVVTKIERNPNDGTTKLYTIFNLENERLELEGIAFYSTNTITYEVIRG